MDKQKAEDIFWVLSYTNNFIEDYDNPDDFLRIQTERDKISNRYSELKATYSFSESLRIATVEWLMNYEIECPEKP